MEFCTEAEETMATCYTVVIIPYLKIHILHAA